MKPLDDTVVESKLQSLDSGWVVKDSGLEKSFELKDFAASLQLANKIGVIAEEKNHHPDLKVSWGELSVRLTSHDAGGITDKDFTFAQLIEDAYGGA